MLDLKTYSTDKTDVFWPGDANPDEVSDEDLIHYIRNGAETLYHPVGTAKIGLDEKDSVVSPDLKVHGVQGLRVIDASIFPSQISGHPVSLLYLIEQLCPNALSLDCHSHCDCGKSCNFDCEDKRVNYLLASDFR